MRVGKGTLWKDVKAEACQKMDGFTANSGPGELQLQKTHPLYAQEL